MFPKGLRRPNPKNLLLPQAVYTSKLIQYVGRYLAPYLISNLNPPWWPEQLNSLYQPRLKRGIIPTLVTKAKQW